MPSKRPPASPDLLDPAIAVELLDRLIGDQAFRTLYQADAGAALASLGHTGAAPVCLTVKTLASPQELQQARNQLQQALGLHRQMAMTVPFCLEAGQVLNSIQGR